MPLSPSDLTMYYLSYRDGRFASVVLEPETRAVSLLPVRLVGFNERRRVGCDVVAVPVFRAHCLHGEHTIAPTAILLEPDELPAVLRDMLWPREVPVEPSPPVAPVGPPFPDSGNIDDEPVAADSSDYATPVVPF